ncbi:MAG: hypothetical protein HQK50_18450 [Oligoflexia bacterium]|nr:hypothetical protein [Oligoflexia bacterium]
MKSERMSMGVVKKVECICLVLLLLCLIARGRAAASAEVELQELKYFISLLDQAEVV